MNILAIDSSARKTGNTRKVLGTFLDKLNKNIKESNADLYIERVHLSEYDLLFCKGCRNCFEKGENYCPNRDSLLDILEKINKADAIVIASPIYLEDINGTMKNWIDRMAFNSHRPKFFGKSLTIITTSGAGATKHAIRTMKTAMGSFGFNIISSGNFICGNGFSQKTISAKDNNKLDLFTKKVIDFHYKKKKLRPSFYSLMVFAVKKRYWRNIAKKDSIDYKYWQDKGWLEKGCDYYYSVDSSKAKIVISRFVGRIVSTIFY